jgi:ribonuclease BN (tRNA processing enzyme)
VAGSSCSIPRVDRACSSYLIEDDKLAVAFDFGTGAFANMRRYADYDRLDAIVISHMHADHFLDLIPLRYALRYGSKRRAGRFPLWLPPDGISMFREMTNAFAHEGGGDFLDEVFDVREYDPDAGLVLGAGRVRFASTTHFIPAFAIRYERNGSSVTYSADTAPDPRVIELARGTDLFLCEATLFADDVELGVRGHSSALEAAQMAAAANVRRLALTHYAEGATERDLQGSAKSVYRGDVVVADDHTIFTV